MTSFLIVTAALGLTYLALTANLQPANLVVGLLLGVGVAALLRPRLPALDARRLPGAFWALGLYLVIVAVDIVKSGLNVARLVLDPKLPIRPGLVAIPSQMDSELGTALSAHAITITPGEMVIEIGPGGVMYTHCLDIDASGPTAVAAQMRRRELLKKIVLHADDRP